VKRGKIIVGYAGRGGTAATLIVGSPLVIFGGRGVAFGGSVRIREGGGFDDERGGRSEPKRGTGFDGIRGIGSGA
jgi:hypothetical protein